MKQGMRLVIRPKSIRKQCAARCGYYAWLRRDELSKWERDLIAYEKKQFRSA